MAHIHTLPKSTHGPLDQERAIIRAALMSRGVHMPMPVVFGGKPVATVGWDRARDRVWCAPFTGRDDIINKVTSSTPQTFDVWWQKSTVGTGLIGIWFDLWPVASGDPDAGTYPGAASTAYVHSPSTDPGFVSVGPALSGGQTRHLTGIDLISMIDTGTPFQYIVYDRVLVYNACPLINGTTTMTNSVSATRYAGVGVQIMVTNQVIVGGAVNLTTLTYVSDGSATHTVQGTPYALDSGRTTSGPAQPAAVMGGTLHLPFLPLAAGDNGVKSITSYVTSAAQTGSLCYVLARPICNITTPVSGQKIHYNYLCEQMNLFPIAADTCIGMVGLSTAGNDYTVGMNLQYAWG